MKIYDYKSVLDFIEKNRDEVQEIQLGMLEDWFWTAVTIFEDNQILVDLNDPDLKIAGIAGSSWATPVMNIVYKNGEEIYKACYTGESDGMRPSWV